VKVLEAVHLLFNYEMFVVVLAVDTRWLAQSLQIRYRQLLGETGSAGPYDYLEKIIQIPVHLLPLDEALVRTMITGLTGVGLTPPREPDDAPAPAPLEAHSSDAGAGIPSDAGAAGALAAHHSRTSRPSLPAEVLKITPAEATALSAVAPLVGTTPRTVKRFVNTYRLLKARADDPAEFGRTQGSIADHEVVAFLLAVVTGRPAVYQRLMPALMCAPDHQTLQPVMAALTPPAAESPAPNPQLHGSAALDPRAVNVPVADPIAAVPLASVPAGAADPALADVLRWLARYPRYANGPAHRYAKWAMEVARFSFTPTTADVIRAATVPR
jgi:KAP family P-loop domain